MATFSEKEMPAPRLELRWTKVSNEMETYWECDYNLVLPLKPFDIRREDDNGNVVYNEKVLHINKTIRRSGPSIYNQTTDTIDTPFRDGAHAAWDAEVLNGLPIYAVAEGRAFHYIPPRGNQHD